MFQSTCNICSTKLNSSSPLKIKTAARWINGKRSKGKRGKHSIHHILTCSSYFNPPSYRDRLFKLICPRGNGSKAMTLRLHRYRHSERSLCLYLWSLNVFILLPSPLGHVRFEKFEQSVSIWRRIEIRKCVSMWWMECFPRLPLLLLPSRFLL